MFKRKFVVEALECWVNNISNINKSTRYEFWTLTSLHGMYWTGKIDWFWDTSTETETQNEIAIIFLKIVFHNTFIL